MTKENNNEDQLLTMFNTQRFLGNRIFSKNKITDNEGNILNFDKIFQEANDEMLTANDLPVIWLNKFIECMEKEIDEVREILPWKHWSKESLGEKKYPELIPRERLRMMQIELIDIWHFLMSAMIVTGIGPQELFEMYLDKNKANIERQENEYNTAHKNEKDNIEIAKKVSSAV